MVDARASPFSCYFTRRLPALWCNQSQVPLLLVTGPGSTDPELVQRAIASLEDKG